MAANVASLVASPRITSTSTITGTGFMKCMPMKRSGRRGLRGELGDRNRRRVARKDHAGAEQRIDFLEHANLQIALFGHSLDHEIGADERRRYP